MSIFHDERSNLESRYLRVLSINVFEKFRKTIHTRYEDNNMIILLMLYLIYYTIMLELIEYIGA